MAHRPAVPQLIRASRVIAIGRGIPADRSPRVAEALAAGGVRAMELTLNAPEAEALAAIEAVAGRASDLGVLVGAGTVLSIGSAERALDAGAGFIVSPHTDAELVSWCAHRDVPCFPGALTPTEILAAWDAGASAVKLFPAAAVGPGYLTQLAGPFPGIELVPTGGVSAETAGAWIAAGAVAIGVGSWLVGDADAAGVTARARHIAAAVSESAGKRARR
jgi:2-dehydro-3-deoxyphosphogluconate aldolase/(4S)-4-hydroxy-2-oxoglutarate aldolase